MVNKGDAIGWNDWRGLPIEQQMGWRIPITTMFNISHFRRTHPVILVSDFLRLHNLSADTERSNGIWARSLYHEHANVFDGDPERKPSLFVIENSWYDPPGLNRVEELPVEMRVRGQWDETRGDPTKGESGSWGNAVNTPTSRSLQAAIPGGKSVLSWEDARGVLQAALVQEDEDRNLSGNSERLIIVEESRDDSGLKMERRWNLSTDENMERILHLNGWEVLHTYSGAQV